VPEGRLFKNANKNILIIDSLFGSAGIGKYHAGY
jgi:hypothetical protein